MLGRTEDPQYSLQSIKTEQTEETEKNIQMVGCEIKQQHIFYEYTSIGFLHS